ncbi:hypothetical protein HCN44_005005 [Aphidius gifuensis]|uniref:Kazal-like domain-containing protein n=1 Tax=Aphidius gifuensis TaxID=684658 RepID=A0A834XV05_APHGI|nr:uncharacterized protein LOC122852549 [Aphidius gifuensis]KAF7992661.1 hypothetical protein HCN44_005005 [Aphidius gifuensis]
MIKNKIILSLFGVFVISNFIPVESRPQIFDDDDIFIADGFSFDGPADGPRTPIDTFQPTNRPVIPTQRPVTQKPTTVTTTTASPEFTSCTRSCLTTQEYNPVCGNDAIMYNNPGLLGCAKKCGKNVEIQNFGRCVSNPRT